MKSFPNLGLRLVYDGKGYRGFQRQSRGASIQADVESALSIILKHKVEIEFSSRTDAGVHARDQWVLVREGVSLFDRLSPQAKRTFLISINAVLPESIKIWSHFALREDFRPKVSPRWKEYEYRVLLSPAPDPLARDRELWFYADLDLEEMRRAFSIFEGIHDFSGFATSVRRYQNKTHRQIFKTQMIVRPHSGMDRARHLTFRVRGKGFLHHMVRTMVGTVLEVGRGRGRAERIREILNSKQRVLAGVNAPPHPLILTKTSVSRQFVAALKP